MGIITVIGSINIDLVVRTSRLPEAGETLVGSDFNYFPGGKGANQAIAASRSGASTQIIGCIGNDIFGSVLFDSLNQGGVDTSGVNIATNHSSGVATIIVDEKGENRIILVEGSNALVSTKQVDNLWPAISRSTAIILQNEIPLETTFYIIKRAALAGIKVVLNASPFYQIPREILSKVNVLIVNEVESSALCGMPVINQDTAINAAQSLLKRGVETVIVTLGKKGAVLVNGQSNIFQAAFKVNVVDTTAAGDTFVGAYTASINNGDSPADALIYASAAAGLSVTRLGAQPSIPKREDVIRFINFYHRPK